MLLSILVDAERPRSIELFFLLVMNRNQVLTKHTRDWVEPRTQSASQQDSLHPNHPV